MSHNCGIQRAHMGGALSCVELLAVLYKDVLNFDRDKWDERDRFFLSKAHSIMAQYAAMKQVGLLEQSDIDIAQTAASPLKKHPKMDIDKGIEVSGGSLGQCLSIGVGTAMALRRKGNDHTKVYVLLGDGECNEGQIWEAVMSIKHYNLKNIVIIVDRNQLQNDGPVESIMNVGRLEDIFAGFGFETITVDGHNCEEVKAAFEKETKLQKVIIADTVKGKGVSFAEGVVEWHTNILTDELYERAMKEQED